MASKFEEKLDALNDRLISLADILSNVNLDIKNMQADMTKLINEHVFLEKRVNLLETAPKKET